MHKTKAGGDAELELLQHKSFSYFLHESNQTNGLVLDKSAPGWPASIAATGLALSCYPVAIERGLMSKAGAIERTLAALRFFWNSPQGPEPDATGYKGLYYHFLDMKTGRRTWQCELSTVDTAFLLAGALTAAQYFSGDTPHQIEIRELADALYRRADWAWAQNGGETLTHGWHPETGFIKFRWEGYDEALLLYTLALGSPTHPLTSGSYSVWSETYQWDSSYGYDFVYAGPLFTHQLSHCWIDFRGIQDNFMRSKGIDYFENSRRATYAQREYAIDNPQGFKGYGPHCWGITASDGPGPATAKVDGVERQFYDYIGRGAPYGPDDGTVAPWVVVASLPFAPDIVLPAIDYYVNELKLTHRNLYGFKATYNPTWSMPGKASSGWVSPFHFGINQGPIVLMIENYRTGMLWNLMHQSPYIKTGLKKAGFTGGWLDAD